MKIANTLEDYSRLLSEAGKDYPIIAGFEPTADYHRNIVYWLSESGVDCQLFSSLGVIKWTCIKGATTL